jgi:hypothetical protein
MTTKMDTARNQDFHNGNALVAAIFGSGALLLFIVSFDLNTLAARAPQVHSIFFAVAAYALNAYPLWWMYKTVSRPGNFGGRVLRYGSIVTSVVLAVLILLLLFSLFPLNVGASTGLYQQMVSGAWLWWFSVLVGAFVQGLLLFTMFVIELIKKKNQPATQSWVGVFLILTLALNSFSILLSLLLTAGPII